MIRMSDSDFEAIADFMHLALFKYEKFDVEKSFTKEEKEIYDKGFDVLFKYFDKESKKRKFKKEEMMKSDG